MFGSAYTGLKNFQNWPLDFFGKLSKTEKHGIRNRYIMQIIFEKCKQKMQVTRGLGFGGLSASVRFQAFVKPEMLVVDQHFKGAGKWDDEPIIQKHRRLIGDELGSDDGAMIINESVFPKSSEYSVGVARQYCGILEN
jgi:DDE superfamily endonuclease